MPSLAEGSVDGGTGDAGAHERLDNELSGLDALELVTGPTRSVAARAWGATWPKAAATALFFGVWQLVVLSGWKSESILPGPDKVVPELWRQLVDGKMLQGLGITMSRAGIGFAIALVAGAVVGLAVARVPLLRTAIGSMITGLQTMPSIAWFPLAIVLFGLSESAILFVLVIGAAPAIANGIIAGVDTVPPLLDRVGTVLGARGVARFRHVILPAAMPQIIAGMKQGWAFAWRSLMAGELIVILANRPSIGAQLQNARDLSDYPWMMATMMLIFLVGIGVDSLVFGMIERSVLRRRGLGGSVG
jgi:NitT/TauT family transport system permease protein